MESVAIDVSSPAATRRPTDRSVSAVDFVDSLQVRRWLGKCVVRTTQIARPTRARLHV